MEPVPLSRRQKLNPQVIPQSVAGYPPSDIAFETQSNVGTVVSVEQQPASQPQPQPALQPQPVLQPQPELQPQPQQPLLQPTFQQPYPPYPPYPPYSASSPQLNPPQAQHQYPVAEYMPPTHTASAYPAHPAPASIHTRPTSRPQTLTSTYTSEKPRPSKHRPTTTTTAQEPIEGTANSLLNCLKDSVRSLSFADMAPAITLMSAAMLHHSINRKSGHLVPYKRSPWVRSINNALFAYNCWGFAKDNGIIKSRQPEGGMAKREVRHDGSREVLGYRDVDSVMDNPIEEIAGSLFRSKPGDQPYGASVADNFDDRWAVPRATAEHYYDLVYHTRAGVYSANALMLGGAAAVKALHAAHQQHYSGNNPGYKYEQLVVGILLSECSALLERKAEHGYAAADDTMETVGKIALATLIKIKIDEEQLY